MAKVIPIFKSGSMAEIDNYRPISILPTLSKILEKMVHKQLINISNSTVFFLNTSSVFAGKRQTEAKLLEQSSLTFLKRLTPSVTPFC